MCTSQGYDLVPTLYSKNKVTGATTSGVYTACVVHFANLPVV